MEESGFSIDGYMLLLIFGDDLSNESCEIGVLGLIVKTNTSGFEDSSQHQQVLLLDEVTADLDVVARMDLLEFFKEECEQVHKTSIIVDPAKYIEKLKEKVERLHEDATSSSEHNSLPMVWIAQHRQEPIREDICYPDTVRVDMLGMSLLLSL
ncbi:hypothetical protein L6452_01060 [Arctium lappa]|uniref:Uncharacterized protein n=1 Tax=Arctium lappa TaxID=4217 RepID=A0ACB9FGH1_ARCLA|nr:hypothetical protein L6452_01060 [Arctium lappa]